MAKAVSMFAKLRQNEVDDTTEIERAAVQFGATEEQFAKAFPNLAAATKSGESTDLSVAERDRMIFVMRVVFGD